MAFVCFCNGLIVFFSGFLTSQRYLCGDGFRSFDEMIKAQGSSAHENLYPPDPMAKKIDEVKIIGALILAAVALGGACLARWSAQFPTKVVRLCNAGAGGVLLAVVLVHMLSDNAETLQPVGEKIGQFLGGARLLKLDEWMF